MTIVDAIIENQGAFLFVLARVAAFFFAIPLIGGAGVPNMVKALIVLSIAVVLFQLIEVETRTLNMAQLAIGLAGEVMIGVTISLGVRMIFGAVEIGSSIVGIQMGFAAANLFDPVSNQQVSLIARFQGLVALLIFMSVNGHYILIENMVRSFQWIPSFAFYPSGSIVGFMMKLAGEMFFLGMKISMPIIVSLLMANVAIGILGRVVPQLNVLLFSFPITITLGLFVLGVSLPLFASILQREIAHLREVVPLFLLGMQR